MGSEELTVYCVENMIHLVAERRDWRDWRLGASAVAGRIAAASWCDSDRTDDRLE